MLEPLSLRPRGQLALLDTLYGVYRSFIRELASQIHAVLLSLLAFHAPSAIHLDPPSDAEADNSEGNPRNPSHPPGRVTYGEQTTNEMGLAFLTFALPTPADALAFRRAAYESR